MRAPRLGPTPLSKAPPPNSIALGARISTPMNLGAKGRNIQTRADRFRWEARRGEENEGHGTGGWSSTRRLQREGGGRWAVGGPGFEGIQGHAKEPGIYLEGCREPLKCPFGICYFKEYKEKQQNGLSFLKASEMAGGHSIDLELGRPGLQSQTLCLFSV